MTEWREVTIADLAAPTEHALATGPFGSAISSKHFRDEGVPIIRGSNLSSEVGTRLKDHGFAFLAPEKAATFQRSTVRRGDLIFTCWGTIGQIGLIDERARFERYVVSNKQMKLTPDPLQVSSLFLYYALSTNESVKQVQGRATGAAVPGFNLGQLKTIRLRVPSLETQEAVAKFLSAFDDLIENNRRRVEVLEEMARAIYREWFVHFRFPGHEDTSFVDSDLGPIPEGWSCARLVDVAKITMGQSPKSEFYNDEGVGLPFHQGVKNFGRYFPSHVKYCSVENRLAEDDDVLVSVRAPVGRLNTADCRLVIGRGLAAVRSIHGRQALLLGSLQVVFSEEDSMGGGTIFKAITKKELENVKVPCAPDELAGLANARLAELRSSIRVLTYSAQRLASMRDLLLPRLVTGQIDVSDLDLDSVVERVAG